MPVGELENSTGSLVNGVETTFENELGPIFEKLTGHMTAQQLALSRASTPGPAQLPMHLYNHFVNHWLTPLDDDTPCPKSFPEIPAASIAAEIKRGFAEAATTACQKGIKEFTCRWVKADDPTTFKVIPIVSGDKKRLTILLLTPLPV